MEFAFGAEYMKSNDKGKRKQYNDLYDYWTQEIA